MPAFNNDAFLAAQKTAVDTLLSVVNTALASAERVAALNLHATREAFEDMASNGKAVLSVKSPQDAMALPANMAQPHIEKGVAYTRSVYEITTAAREDATAIVEGKFEEFKKSMATLANKIETTTPVGSEVAIATLKSAIDTANKAFARFNDSMNQFKELTESNVALVGNAAVKAVPKSKS